MDIIGDSETCATEGNFFTVDECTAEPLSKRLLQEAFNVHEGEITKITHKVNKFFMASQDLKNFLEEIDQDISVFGKMLVKRESKCIDKLDEKLKPMIEDQSKYLSKVSKIFTMALAKLCIKHYNGSVAF